MEYCQLSALLKTAESLKVKGLAEMTNLGPSRDYKQEAPPEQTEPTELVNKRPLEDREHPPLSPQRLCRSPVERERPPSVENVRPGDSPSEECGPSDMRLHSNGNSVSTCSNVVPAPMCSSRIPSPINSDPVPGPSNMPPVQQVPLVRKNFFSFYYHIKNIRRSKL